MLSEEDSLGECVGACLGAEAGVAQQTLILPASLADDVTHKQLSDNRAINR